MASSIIPRTIRLFNDAYLKQFTARVIRVEGIKVWLDTTAFYADSGGQPGDTGTLRGKKVTDTRFEDREKKCIVHFLDSDSSFKVGDEVQGVIDWVRRHKLMRVHSASHIMEHFLFQICGEQELKGTRLSETNDSSTYEFKITDAQLSELNKRVNEFIKRNLPITTYDDDKKEGFRWWKCDDILIPCGGTHPKSTEEIGPVEITKKSNGSKKDTMKTFLKS